MQYLLNTLGTVGPPQDDLIRRDETREERLETREDIYVIYRQSRAALATRRELREGTEDALRGHLTLRGRIGLHLT